MSPLATPTASSARHWARKKRPRAVITLAFITALLFGAFQGFTPLGATAKAASVPLCGTTGTAPAITHVVVVMMENLSYKQVVGSPNAPYQTSLASQCGNATSAFGATHTSAANYLGTSAGEYPTSSPKGCGSVKQCVDPSNNVYNQLSSVGDSWNAFIESMPSPCDPSSSGNYKNGHNPVIFYSDLTSAECQAGDLGVPDLTAQSGAFWNDLQNQTLPSLSWITPDEADDGEGAGTGAQNEQASDTWLQNFMTTVGQSNSYQSGNTVVLVTYDEGSGPDSTVGEDCTNESLDMPVTNNTSAHQDSCHVPLFVVNPYTPAGDSDPTFFTHYSITKTIEDIFGLPYLAGAGNATTNSLIGHFGLQLGVAPITPTVAITAPLGGASVSGTIPISGTAADPAGVTDIQISVDNGPSQTASGTTNWTSSLNTSSLSNGSHTITATATDTNGNTGSASVTISVNNPLPTSCPATPPGMTELSGNLSLETSQTGWTGTYNSNSLNTRVEPSGGSYDGSWALQIAPKAGDTGAAGVNNASPIWVPGLPGLATITGSTYTGSAYVKASTPGETVSLLIRETTLSGTGVSYHTTTMTLPDTAWHQISSVYTAQDSGDLIRYTLSVSNFANSGQNLLADCLSLQTP